MKFVFPHGAERFLKKLVDWTGDDIRLGIVMANSVLGDHPEAEFVADLTSGQLDEYDGSGYARTQLTGCAILLDTTGPVLTAAVTADETVTASAIGVGTRQAKAAFIYRHVGADSVNPLLFYFDDAPWFPFNGAGTKAHFKWSADGIFRWRLTV